MSTNTHMLVDPEHENLSPKDNVKEDNYPLSANNTVDNKDTSMEHKEPQEEKPKPIETPATPPTSPNIPETKPVTKVDEKSVQDTKEKGLVSRDSQTMFESVNPTLIDPNVVTKMRSKILIVINDIHKLIAQIKVELDSAIGSRQIAAFASLIATIKKITLGPSTNNFTKPKRIVDPEPAPTDPSILVKLSELKKRTASTFIDISAFLEVSTQKASSADVKNVMEIAKTITSIKRLIDDFYH